MADEQTIAIYADTKGVSVCRGTSCRQRILWVVIVDSKKRMCFHGNPKPLSVQEDLTGRKIEYLPFKDNHWATCPDAPSFGKKGKQAR